MKKFFLLFILVFSPIVSVFAQSQPVELYFFWGDGCPHCEDAKPFIQELEKKYPSLEIYSKETWYNPENAELFEEKLKQLGIERAGVPTFIIDDRYVIGFNSVETTGQEVENIIKEKLGEANIPTPTSSTIISLPIFGEVDYSKMSLISFTFIVALIDGFNACAMWVLCFLLSLLVYSRSRKRMFLVGGIFIFVSGLVYFSFMMAWLQIVTFIQYRNLIQWIIGLLAIFMAVINIKDFFWFKKGLSFSIPDKYKPKIFEKMRVLVYSQSILGILLGTAVLAFLVNLVELACTAGLPNIFVSVLEFNNVPFWQKILYLIFYNVIYMIDDLIVFTIAVITMSSKKVQETEGRWLKLISGIVIGVLGILMIFKPEILMFG